MAEFNNLYQRAVYYDVVFKRDVMPEIDFIKEVYCQHHGRPPRALLDLACGPGYHARAFARQGGRAVGLDLREEMLHFAAEQAAAEGVTSVEWVAADMRSLELDAPVDVALNAFDGIDCLTSNEDLIAHFRAIAANLTPGGLYLIDVTHPRLTDFSCYQPVIFAGSRDGIDVEIRWATNQPVFDPVTHIADTELELHIQDHGKQFVIKDTARERLVSGQEITLLSMLAGGLTPVAWYGAYDLNQPLQQSPDAPRMIAVLQKVETPVQ
jgi:SAM-dependent methyltransferase